MSNPVCERFGLPRTRAGDHQERRAWRSVRLPHVMLDSLSLFRIEALKMGDAQLGNWSAATPAVNHNSRFVREEC